MSVSPYLLAFFLDTELFLGYEFSLTSKLATAWNHCHPWQFCNEHPCSFWSYEFSLTPKLAAA